MTNSQNQVSSRPLQSQGLLRLCKKPIGNILQQIVLMYGRNLRRSLFVRHTIEIYTDILKITNLNSRLSVLLFGLNARVMVSGLVLRVLLFLFH